MNLPPAMLPLLVLAVVQGVTEFLPVSSSGHLVLMRELFGWSDEGGLGVDIVLHAGSLAAILIYFRRTWLDILVGCLRPGDPGKAEARRLLGLLVLATLPVAAAGLLLKPILESPFVRDGVTVGLSMMATALLFWFCDLRTPPVPRPPGIRQALFAGTMQIIALLPGASRSGWTTAGSLFAGQSREASVRFAFYLAVPAIGGALALQARDIVRSQAAAGPAWFLAAGFAASLLASLAAIHFCLIFFRRHTLRSFSPYLAAVGLLALMVSL